MNWTAAILLKFDLTILRYDFKMKIEFKVDGFTYF
jgi:hypothetical protein